MRFRRNSERSAERSVRRPLTLMNSVRTGTREGDAARDRCRGAAGARAGEKSWEQKQKTPAPGPASCVEGSGERLSDESACSASFFRVGATPQDRIVLNADRLLSLTSIGELNLSEFKSEVDGCLLDQRIERLTQWPLFTLNEIEEQEFFSKASRELFDFFNPIRSFASIRASRTTSTDAQIATMRACVARLRFRASIIVVASCAAAVDSAFGYSQLSAPPDWYSMTRVSKKLRSFLRSIISAIQGNGLSSAGNIASMPICCARRLAI